MNLFNTYISQKSKTLVQQVLDSGFLNQGPMVEELESKLATDLHFTNPVTLNSCTASLHLALILSEVKPGDEVVIPTQTFIATGLAVLMVGATPVFADITQTGCMDVESLKSVISPKTKAVICVHWAGIPCDLEKISEVCKENNLILIEDAAHAMGATYKQSVIGDCKYSDFACFSLQCIKNLTAGDGGILCCKSLDAKLEAIKLRWFGMDKSAIKRDSNGQRIVSVDTLGYKYHMNDVSAAIALGNLESLKERINISRSYARLYIERLPHLVPRIDDVNAPSYWFMPLLSIDRDGYVKKLRAEGIPAGIVDSNIDGQPIFRKNRRPKAEYTVDDFFPHTMLYNKIYFAIPCHSELTLSEVGKICDILAE